LTPSGSKIPAFHRIVAVAGVITVGLFAGMAAADDKQTCVKASGDLAIAACTRAIASGQYNTHDLGTLYFDRGAEYAGKGEHDRAIQDYDQAIRLNPQDADAFHNRGAEYARKGQHDRAIKDFDQAIRLNPHHADVFYNRGLAKRKKGDTAGGDTDIARARQLQPGIGQ
jgi:tetratricopeptide (TPR) repeat protein